MKLLVLLLSLSTQPYYLNDLKPKDEVKRIVSLAPSITEMIFRLGQGKRLVGVTKFDDYPEEVRSIAKVGGFIDPSLEAIINLKPDLVICVPNSGNQKKISTLARLKIPTLVIPAYQLADIYKAIETLGEIFNRRKQAKSLVQDLRQRASAVTARVQKKTKPKVLIVYGHKPIIAAGPGSFADEMLSLAGGINVAGDSTIRYPSIPIEMVIKLAPDVIIDASSAKIQKDPKRSLALWRRWSMIPAVANHRIYSLDSVYFFRPGPRIVDGIEHLARLLHSQHQIQQAPTTSVPPCR